jgi:hypothetical protein
MRDYGQQAVDQLIRDYGLEQKGEKTGHTL